METLRWGVLSTASIATRKVIPGIRRAERAALTAIASRSVTTAERVAAELGIPKAYGSYEELLSDPDVDAIYNPLPNHLHAEWTIAALQAGKHVLCEKPVGLDVAEAERMAAAAESSGRLLMEAFMYRHHPSWKAALDLVAHGAIGELRAVDSWFSYYLDDPSNIRSIRSMGGGALYDIGCYNVNLSRLLFGGEPLEVAATMVVDPATDVDVLASGTMTFEGGVASFTCATQVEPDQRVSIYGSTGRIAIDIPFNIPPTIPTRIRVTTGRSAPESWQTEVIEFAPADPYGCEVDAFSQAVIEGLPVPVPMADAIANMRVLERLFEAAGRPIA